ncbi:hypothetical protein COXBURSA334_1622 [Coxiella burnetii Q321]|nr:hypothetical protein COXBURSA334_1622 [Coxiella burnetii Q321]
MTGRLAKAFVLIPRTKNATITIYPKYKWMWKTQWKKLEPLWSA